MTVWDDTILWRNPASPGWMPLAFLEHYFGANPVILSNREPDPNTCRDEYYYNTRTNILYKKIETNAIGCSSEAPKVWKAVSER